MRSSAVYCASVAAQKSAEQVAATLRVFALLLGAALFASVCWPAWADLQAAQSAERERTEEGKTARAFKFLGGAALGLVTHEAGHFTLDEALGTHPFVKGVDFAGIPFFAVTYHGPVPPRERYAIASGGFWVQQGLSEWILTRTPDLRRRQAPMAKGILAFHVATSLAYAGAAFAHAGPVERDTYGMAQSLRVDERWVGALILAPATLDAYRYYHPRSRWAPWASRGFKLATILLVLR
jgi:hypothetical protein